MITDLDRSICLTDDNAAPYGFSLIGSLDLFIRGRTEEIKGPNEREPIWGGLILSKAY